MSPWFYPWQMGRILLLAMEETLGREGMSSVLRLASLTTWIDGYPSPDAERTFPFENVSRLLQALEWAYGPQGGRGAALRIGRACFQRGLREYGPAPPTFRFLPLSQKIAVGARALADFFNDHSDQRVSVREGEGELFWSIERCPLCWEQRAAEPLCYLAVGLIQEALYWVSGGKSFDVKETTCLARGESACTFAIDLMPFS